MERNRDLRQISDAETIGEGTLDPGYFIMGTQTCHIGFCSGNWDCILGTGKYGFSGKPGFRIEKRLPGENSVS